MPVRSQDLPGALCCCRAGNRLKPAREEGEVRYRFAELATGEAAFGPALQVKAELVGVALRGQRHDHQGLRSALLKGMKIWQAPARTT
jgi:hypothetical protein